MLVYVRITGTFYYCKWSIYGIKSWFLVYDLHKKMIKTNGWTKTLNCADLYNNKKIFLLDKEETLFTHRHTYTSVWNIRETSNSTMNKVSPLRGYAEHPNYPILYTGEQIIFILRTTVKRYIFHTSYYRLHFLCTLAQKIHILSGSTLKKYTQFLYVSYVRTWPCSLTSTR